MQIEGIQFEHHPTGFGVGQARPRLSWRISASEGHHVRNWVQTAYELQIGWRHNGEAETHRVESSQSVLVPWAARSLKSRESVWIKVKAHGLGADLDGRPMPASTGWSDEAPLEIALLDNQDWTAKLMVSSISPDNTKPLWPLLFRKCFPLPAEVSKISTARLYITAHGVYQAFINGHRMGADEMAPGWTSYKHRLPYQSFDVGSCLETGKVNVIGVEGAEGWYAGRLGMDHKRCFYGEQVGLIVQLEVLFESGNCFTLVSDDTWKSCHSATTRSEIYDGEDYDARLEKRGWNSDQDFDESSWVPTKGLPLPTARLLALDQPPVRVTEEIAALRIFKSQSGKVLVDFGQNLAGKVRLQLSRLLSSPALVGHKLSLSHAEVLEHRELGTRPLRGARPIDSVILSQDQPQTWAPKFTFHGFRYVQLDGWPDEFGLPRCEELTALVLHTDMNRTGWFSCSNSQINQLHQNAVWSMRGNFLSVPTDCPQRDERLGWTGDVQVFTKSASFLYDINGVLGSWLADLEAEQFEHKRQGVPGLVVPDVFDSPPFPPDPQCAWHDAAVLTPWDLYTSSGDRELLRRQYASMKAWVDQGLPRGPNGLWDQNVWQFGDWLDPSAPPNEPGKAATDSQIVADAYLVRVLETISTVSELLGEANDSARYSEDAKRVRKTFQNEYVTRAGLLVGDSQTGYAIAIGFGLLMGEEQRSKAASRLRHLVHAARYRIATGFVGTPSILHALSHNGDHQLAYRMLLEDSCPSWLYPVSMGATTIWERWDSMLPDGSINPGSMTSFNHYALGSVVTWLHHVVGGISPLEPGWRKFKVKPLPGGGLTSAQATFDSPYGRIVSSWDLDDHSGTFRISVTVPPNTIAVVVLPRNLDAGARDEQDGVQVGSGNHQFSCSIKQAAWPPHAEFRRSTFRLEL